jgi:hypothetical protein
MSTPIGSQTANIAMTVGMPPKHISRTRRATFFSLVGLGTIVGAWLSFIFLSENGMRSPNGRCCWSSSRFTTSSMSASGPRSSACG